METTTNNEAMNLNITTYPESVTETKSLLSLTGLAWAAAAAVLYILYSQLTDKDSTLGIILISGIIVSIVIAMIKLCNGSSKLTYTPTGSPVNKELHYYNIGLENDVMECITEGNTARLKALKADDMGGIMVEMMVSKDKVFTAARMHKHTPAGYEPQTEWNVMN